MTTPIVIALVFVLSLILLIGGTRRFIGQAIYVGIQLLIWLSQQVFNRTPGWLAAAALGIRTATTAAAGPFVNGLRWLGFVLGILILATVVSLWSGNVLAQATLAAVLGTIAYIPHRFVRLFGRTAFGLAALVLYGLAVAGFLYLGHYLVALLLVLVMLDITWSLLRSTRFPRPAKWAIGSVTSLALVALALVIVGTQVGWVDLQVGRGLFDNRVLNDQASAEVGFHEQARPVLDATVREIHEKLGNELVSGNPNPAAADAEIARLAAQKAVMAKAEEVSPVSGSSKWRLPRLRSSTLLPMVGFLIIGLGALLIATRQKGGH